MRNILIYRSELLPLSETFIRAQAGALRRHRPHFVGLRATTPSLLDGGAPLLAADHARLPAPLARAAYGYLGAAPLLHRGSFLQQLRALEPALVHAHFATDAVAALPLAAALGVPLIVTLHGYDVTVRPGGRNPLRRWARQQGAKALGRRAALFLCVSKFIRCRAIAAGYPAEKLLTHHIGIDIGAFQPAPQGTAGDTVLFVGRLTEKKGCEYLIRAMVPVQRQRPGAELVVAGDGPLRASLEDLAAALRVRARFTGAVHHDAVREHLLAARLLVLPSVTAANGDSEGLGMVQLEAQCMGVPVVATRHGGIPEGIVDGHAGLLSDERDVPGLARNILRLLQDDALHAGLSRRGVQLVQQEFDLRQQTAQLEMVYDAALRGADAVYDAVRAVAPVPLKSCCSARATL
jgi:glycosyltransferase involved in cell wall biosynthesis